MNGVDFLGVNIRKYNGKLIIKPAKDNVKRFLENIRETVKSNKTTKTENLIRQLNPKLIGWAKSVAIHATQVGLLGTPSE